VVVVVVVVVHKTFERHAVGMLQERREARIMVREWEGFDE
jgi:hypothetical protein